MTHSKRSRVLALLLSFVMVLSMFPQTIFAAAGAHITVTEPQAQETSTGTQLKIYMDEIFTDTAGHSLTYSLDDGDYGTHTKLAQDTDGRWMLSFTNATAGTYTPTVTATCTDGDSATVQLRITVTASSAGSDNQYGYDETDAESVKVTVTISSDGLPILGSDGNTVLSHLEVEVPYFDLANQGLDDYYRYHTEDGQGGYVDGEVVKRPTALHLYLYLLGVYYLDLNPEDITTGAVQITEQTGLGIGVYNLNGELAYDDMLGALSVSGSPTSLYMTNFWGHDENLMYYRNHAYPLMSAGWGSTADYILLSDGDTIDLAMFTNWSFWTEGAFAAFDQDSYSISTGNSLNFQTMKYDTRSVADGGTEQLEPIAGLSVAVYDEDWGLVDIVDPLSEGGSNYAYTFFDAGTYYLLAVDPDAGTNDSSYAPATAKVTVGETAFDPDTYYADYDFSSITLDEAGTEYIYNISTGTTYVEHFSNPGDKKLYTVTVPAGTETVYVTYPADFETGILEYCALFDDEGAVSWDYFAGSDYDYTVTENDDGSHTIALPAAFLMENDLNIAAEAEGTYDYFNCFKFVAGDNTRPGGSAAFDPDTYYADYDFSSITLDEAGTEYIYNISTGTTYVEHFTNPGDKKLYTVTVPADTQTVYVTYPADFDIEIAEFCALFDDDGAVSWDYFAGSDYDYTVTENADGSHTIALPAAFLMENNLGIAAEEQSSDSTYEYFNCFKFVAGDNTRPGGNDKIAVTGISISRTELTLDRYTTAQLSAQVLPENANNQRVRWISDDSSVATVDSNGLVTAVTEGTATITASSLDSGFAATCTVTVTDNNKPSQDADGCYEIRTGEQLQWFAREVNGGSYAINGKLMNDIDLSGICSATLGRWTPIGNYSAGRRYEGVFDGQNHAVRGLYLIGDSSRDYRDANSYYVALFGLCDGATIKNLSVYGEAVCGYRYMAGIVGRMCQVYTERDGTIENCHNYVNFSGTPTNDMLYGYAGVVATADKGTTINGCSNHGDIYGLQGQAGGVVASASNCLIENCWNTGKVHLRGYQSGFQGVGGIVGCALGETVVTNCYNTGDVSFYYKTQAVVHYAGGIVGRVGSQYGTHQLTISYCYNTGSISGDLADNSFLGGIVGGNASEKTTTTVLQCYYLDSSAAQDGAEGSEAMTEAQMHAADFVSKLGSGYVSSCPYPVLAIQTATPHVDEDEDGKCDSCGGDLSLHEDTKVGDINGDGEIDILDAGLLVRYCNGLAQLDEQQLLRADVNGDGEIDILDAGLLVRYCNGLITTF